MTKIGSIRERPVCVYMDGWVCVCLCGCVCICWDVSSTICCLANILHFEMIYFCSFPVVAVCLWHFWSCWSDPSLWSCMWRCCSVMWVFCSGNPMLSWIKDVAAFLSCDERSEWDGLVPETVAVVILRFSYISVCLLLLIVNLVAVISSKVGISCREMFKFSPFTRTSSGCVSLLLFQRLQTSSFTKQKSSSTVFISNLFLIFHVNSWIKHNILSLLTYLWQKQRPLQSCVMMRRALLWSVTTDPVSARLVSPETTHPEPSSRLSWADPGTRWELIDPHTESS